MLRYAIHTFTFSAQGIFALESDVDVISILATGSTYTNFAIHFFELNDNSLISTVSECVNVNIHRSLETFPFSLMLIKSVVRVLVSNTIRILQIILHHTLGAFTPYRTLTINYSLLNHSPVGSLSHPSSTLAPCIYTAESLQ